MKSKRNKLKSFQTSSPSFSGRSRLARAFPPWNAVVVGIDQGKVSGFSCWVRGEFYLAERVDSAAMRRDCVQYAYTRARGKHLPLIFVFEKHNPYTPKKEKFGKQVMLSYKTLIGMGESRGKWKQEIEMLPVPAGLPKTNIVGIPTMTWKRAHGITGRREDAKKAAIIKAKSIVKDTVLNDDNVAEAVLIGQVGCYSELCYLKGMERV